MDWKKFFDALGMDGTRWLWRINHWEQRWQDWRSGALHTKERVTYRHKICPRCGAIVDQNENVCSACGVRLPGWRTQVLQRSLGLVLPRWCPVTTLLLAAIFLDLLVAMFLFGGRHLLLPESMDLVRMGALVPLLTWYGEYWRIITYGYLHVGLLHIAFNAMALSQAGTVLEEEIGGARFFVVYTLTLAGGAIADLLVRGPVIIPIAGASGALFGLIGFGIGYAQSQGGERGRMMRNFFLHWALYGFLFGYAVRADNIAHLGGFLPGLALGFLVERERGLRDRFTPIWSGAAWFCLAVTVASFVWLIIANRGAIPKT